MRVYVGTYTRENDSQGIYRCNLDPASGELTLEAGGPFVANPSYLTIHPRGRSLYACSEMAGPGETVGAVSALSIDPATGDLALVNQQSTLGPGPCHVSVDATGRLAMAANYVGGSVCALPILADGSLAPASSFHQHVGASADPRRQSEPHGHSIWPDPSNRWALACDLGLDQVMVYAMDPAQGTLTPPRWPYARIAAGCGPRHLDWHPTGRWVYVLNEMRSSVTCFDWDPAHGLLREFAHVPALPADYTAPNGAADIHITPDGRYLYASNRGQNALAIFCIGEESGLLTLLGYAPTGGDHPRNFAISPDGHWLLAANMRSDSIVTFRIEETGWLTPTGSVLSLPSPSCIKFWRE